MRRQLAHAALALGFVTILWTTDLPKYVSDRLPTFGNDEGHNETNGFHGDHFADIPAPENALDYLWQGLANLRVGNHTVGLIESHIINSAKNLTTLCVHDMLRSIKSLTLTGLFSASCHLDNIQNSVEASRCFDNNTKHYLWSVKLFDAWGKPPSGLASSGPFFLMGDYDQCLSIQIPADNISISSANTTSSAATTGKYCRVAVDVVVPIKSAKIPVNYGFCVPATCTNEDVQEVIGTWLNQVLNNSGIDEKKSQATLQCHAPETKDASKWMWIFEMTANEQFFVILLLLLFLCVISGTLVDLYMHSKVSRVNAGVDCHSYNFYYSRPAYDYHSPPLSEASRMVFDDNLVHRPWRERAGGAIWASTNDEVLSIAGAPSVALTYKASHEVIENITTGNFFVDLLSCFSIRRSVEHLLRDSGSQIATLHGIKVVSAAWVIIGHTFVLSAGYVGNLLTIVKKIKTSGMAQWIFNSSLAVDTFFLTAAAVLTFSIRRKLLTAGHDTDRARRLFTLHRILSRFIHRLLRILPGYAFALGFVAIIFNRLGSGPMWNTEEGVFGTHCNVNNTWPHLAFVLNFYPSDCMPWMWYLSLDSQFYLAALLGMFVFRQCSTSGKTALVLLLLVSVVYRFAIYVTFNFPLNIVLKMIEKESVIHEEAAQMFVWLYAFPLSRLPPSVLGLCVGWILGDKKSNAFMTPKSRTFLRPITCVLSLGLLWWGIAGASLWPGHKAYQMSYAALYRTSWSIGMAIFVWLCERRHFGPIGAILAWSKWVPLSRLCFGIYLSHELIILALVYQRRRVWVVESPFEVITFALGVGVLSTLCSFLMAVFVETPPLNIERKLFMRLRKNIRVKNTGFGNWTLTEAASVQSRGDVNDQDFSEDNPLLADQVNAQQSVVEWLGAATRHMENELEPLYPWDSKEWLSDSRIHHTHAGTSVPSTKTAYVDPPLQQQQQPLQVPSAITSSTDTEIIDARNCVVSAHVASLVRIVPSQLHHYGSTEA